MRKLAIFLGLLFICTNVYAHGFTTNFSGGIGERLTFKNGEFLDNDTNGIICLNGGGGTNNEDICFDLEVQANGIAIKTTTGVTRIVIPDEYGLGFGGVGGSGDIRFIWETTGNDNFQIGTGVGSAAQSGYISIMQNGDLNDANRSPSGTSADPVLRVYSSDATSATDYIEFSHNQTNAVISAGAGQTEFTNTWTQSTAGFFHLRPVTSDPCAGGNAGGIFFNSLASGQKPCICDKGGNDVELENSGVACF